MKQFREKDRDNISNKTVPLTKDVKSQDFSCKKTPEDGFHVDLAALVLGVHKFLSSRQFPDIPTGSTTHIDVK